MVETVAKLVERACAAETNIFGYGIWTHHITKVLENWEKILKNFGYPAEKIEAVKHAIAAHRGSVKIERRTPEAECLAAADAMAHIEQLPSLMFMVYTKRKMNIDEGAAWVRARLERSWSKLNPQVQDLVKEQYVSALKALGERPSAVP
jgi:uncharacterized protein